MHPPCRRPLGLRAVRRVPTHVVWEITNACNLRCVHCESAAGSPRDGELDTAEALGLVDDLAALGCREINLSGGEPLLREDWPAIVARIVERGMKPIVVSNLTLLDEATLDRLEALGVRSIATSVDGPPPVHDRIRRNPGGDFSPWARTLDAMRRVKARGMFLSVVTHVSLWNIEHLDETARILEDEGVDLWQLQVGFPEGRLAEIAEDYLIFPRQLRDLYAFVVRVKRRGRLRVDVADDLGYYGPDELLVREQDGKTKFWTGCMAGYRVLSICADGAVRGCPSLRIDVGNVREEPLAEIWADEKRFWFNACWNPDELEGKCRGCPYRMICRGGCKSLALSTTGTIYRNIYCINQIDRLKGDPELRMVRGRVLPPPGGGGPEELP